MFGKYSNMIKQGDNIPEEYKYITLEPRTYKSYIDFVIMYRWMWFIKITVLACVFAAFGWIVALISFLFLQALWYFLYKFYFKRLEHALNKFKTKFQKLSDSILGY